MPSTYTSNNTLTLQAFNENPSTWGSILNTVFGLVDSSLDGIEAVDVAGSTSTATLTIADGASAQARSRVLNFTGARTVTNITVTIGPNTAEKIYWVKNSTTGGFSVIIAQGSGGTVTIAPGAWALVFLDGAGSGAGVTTLTSFAMAGSSSGITILQPSAAASGTLTLPAATDTLVGRATTDTLSNKTLTAPILGTPASGTLSNCTGLPIATGVSGLATGVATFLATPTSANLAAALTDETGTGSSVFATSPTLATPTITTNATVPTVIGGTGTTSTLSLRSTSGVGATGSAIIFQTGNNGGTEAARIINSGNFGIGATAPAQKLEVFGATSLPATSGTTQNGLLRIASTATNAIDMGLSNASPFGAWIQTSNVTSLATTYPLLLNPNGGNVGIGTTNPAYQLQLSTDSAAKPSTNTWTIASDARLKTVLGDYEKGLDAICALRPVRYEYNGLGGMAADGKEHISIVAQEAAGAFPECIGTFQGKLHEDDEEDTELLNYNGHAVTFALINAIKELKARIETLETA